jgi:hypothetical protein
MRQHYFTQMMVVSALWHRSAGFATHLSIRLLSTSPLYTTVALPPPDWRRQTNKQTNISTTPNTSPKKKEKRRKEEKKKKERTIQVDCVHQIVTQGEVCRLWNRETSSCGQVSLNQHDVKTAFFIMSNDGAWG